MRARRLVLVVLVVVLAACGSSAKKGTGSSGTTAPKALSTALGTGVTATEIRLGISLTDFDCIMQFVDSIFVDQEKIYQAFIDDINKKGGINGRKIVPVIHKFCPIPDPARLASICTKFTEDDKVFAVIGNLFDQTGNAQTCIAKRHNTPLFAFMLTQEIINKSPPGLIILPGNTSERVTTVLTGLLKANHTVDGKKVGILGETTTANAVKKSVEPALQELGVDKGSTAILQIAGADTTAAQQQLDSFIERWKGEGTNALFITGTQVGSKQCVEKIRKEMPDIMLITDVSEVDRFGQEENQAGRKPNPYEGIISARGPTDEETDKGANWKECARIYKEQTGKDAPDSSVIIPGPEGKTIDTNQAIRDTCQMVTLFYDIATKAGPNLNNDTWVNAVDNYGPIRNMDGGQYASLHKGKYDIDDTFRLSAFDSSIPPQGAWKALTELQNIPGS
jgi:ABC-type branched-subunit amino acid transport system substrate-binding protein